MEQTAVVFEEVARLADAELIVGLQRWVRAARSITARMLVHLGEVDARGLYRERAWPSMFAYAVGELHMSEAEAYVRIAAARLGRQFPRVVELLAEGALHLSAIKRLGPHLTADNHVQVLEQARGKSTSEIERLVAELAPKPDVPSRIRKLPAPAVSRASRMPGAPARSMNATSTPMAPGAAQPEAIAPLLAMDADAAQSENTGATQSENSESPTPTFARCPTESAWSTPSCAVESQPDETATASRIEPTDCGQFRLEPAPRKVSATTPLRPGRYKVEFTAGEAMRGKLEQLKALLRHQVPNGDLAIILERAADLLLEKTRKERFAQTSRPRVSKANSRTARVGGAGAHDPRASVADASDGDASPAHTSDATASAAHTSDATASAAHARDATASAAHARDATASASHARAAHRIRPGHAHSRYIPRSVVREVHARDGEQCTFVSPDGRRCPEGGFLELHHHYTPYARDGAATTDNLKMACRAHNSLFAERDFGRAFIHSKVLQARLRKVMVRTNSFCDESKSAPEGSVF